MNQTIENIDKFHQTKKGKIVFGLIELALSYGVISRAIHTGSIWQYAVFAVLFVGGLNNLVKVFIRKNEKSSAKAKPKTSKS